MKAQIERRTERREAGIIDSGDERLAEHARKPISEHIANYEQHLQSHVSEWHFSETRRRLKAIIEGCNVTRL